MSAEKKKVRDVQIGIRTSEETRNLLESLRSLLKQEFNMTVSQGQAVELAIREAVFKRTAVG